VSWRQDPIPTGFAEMWANQMPGVPAPRFYSHRDGRVALVGREPLAPPDGDLRWHISLRAADRIPTWEELSATAHELRPGVPFVVGVPPKSWWINVHEHVLHLWEPRDPNLLAQWQAERRGDTPT
jgi:hypothetical protein